MSLDVEKHREFILRAFNDVVSDKKATDWALFGYEGQTNVLKLVGTGEDGLEELAEDLNSSKIMYAVVKVIDPNTTRPKIVLINWQGEGAPTVRKGTCARHLHDIHKLLRGIHVTVNARTEEEVEPEVVMEAVLKASATTYNFNERSEMNDKTTPVGTNYKRTNPLAEIDSKSRNKFWEEQEEEEKRRKTEEQRLKEEELKRLEMERKQREITETKQRDNLTRERNARILAERRAEEEAAKRLAVKQDEKKWEEELASHHREEEERARRAEVMRLERKKEAEALIGKRTHATRDKFEIGSQQKQEPLVPSGDRNRPPPRRLKEFRPVNDQREESREVNAGGVPGRAVIARWPPAASEPAHNHNQHHTPPSVFRAASSTRTPVQDIIHGPSSPPAPPGKQQQPVNITPTHEDGGSTGHVRNLLREGLPARQDSDDEDKTDKDEWQDDPPHSTSAKPSSSQSLLSSDTNLSQSLSHHQTIHADNQPHISRTYSAYSQAHMTQNQSAPTQKQPSPSFSQPNPTFSQTVPFNQPSPTHSQSSPSYTLSASTYHQSSQSYSQHAVTSDQPVSTYINQMDPPTKQPLNSSPFMQENPVPHKVPATYTNGGPHLYEQSTEEKLSISGGRQSTLNGTHHSKTTINSDDSSLPTFHDSNATATTTVHSDNANSTPAIGMLYEVDGVEYQILPEHGLCARALYDYQAADDTEITFDPSEIITNIDQIDEGWWQGVGPDGMYGLFPANYVELINQATS